MIELMIYVSGVVFVMSFLLAMVIQTKDKLTIVEALKMVVFTCLSWFAVVLVGLYMLMLWWMRKRNMKR